VADAVLNLFIALAFFDIYRWLGAVAAGCCCGSICGWGSAF
jgi:hypothetical protein